MESYAPPKDDKQPMNKTLRIAIMTHSQRNLVVTLNRASKREFFKKLEPTNVDNNKQFWKTVKALLSNTNPMNDKIILVENGEILQEETWQLSV